MTKRIKISILWLLTICGFACHSITDVLPMFWGKDMAVVATDGNVDQGMIVFMMTLSFLISHPRLWHSLYALELKAVENSQRSAECVNRFL